jgi:uncharacterized protein YutE (UPF0331/DUF86 family)
LSKKDEFLIVAQEISSVQKDMAKIAADMAEVIQKVLAKDAADKLEAAYLAFQAMRFFVAAEDVLQKIAKSVDGFFPGGERSHIDLLRQMSLELPGRRPPVISGETFEKLFELRAFRHRLIHAYQEPLAWERMRRPVTAVPECAQSLSDDLTVFRGFLTRLAGNS